ncbi:MAG: hypothetical protein GXP41_11165 [Chloroflexi bacterium]|nr:hypothetical protein [Chloroflexota bacterium]
MKQGKTKTTTDMTLDRGNGETDAVPFQRQRPLNLPFKLINTPEGLQKAVEHLREYPRIAIDTESNSLYVYAEQVCLIQVSVPDMDYLIDPLALADLSPLRPLLADPAIDKVFHAAEYDLIMLDRDLDLHVHGIFDTMWAARIAGWPECGLGALLQTHFGIAQDKRMQRFNWGRRPLPVKALRYAVQDTHFLLPLRDILARELRRLHRWEEAQEVFAELHQVIQRARTIEDYNFWRVKKARLLSPTERGVLQALFLFREEVARQQNQPRFRIMSDKLITRLAQTHPSTRQDLARLDFVPDRTVQRYGTQIIRAIQEGLQNPVDLPKAASNGHRDPQTDVRYETLRAWRKQIAKQRGVDPDVVISNAALHEIAELNPQSIAELAEISILGPWKLQTYGQSLLEAIKTGDTM